MRGVTDVLSLTRSDLAISTHTPHARRDGKKWVFPSVRTISTHTPHARRDYSVHTVCTAPVISTHTPHARRDVLTREDFNRKMKFQLTRLMRGVTSPTRAWKGDEIFQLTRLMRGVTLCEHFNAKLMNISTHTPHARRDSNLLFLAILAAEFQLTRLMRGVTGV